jgi:spermidine/putrescine-binding protein
VSSDVKFQQNSLASGKAAMAIMFSGDALRAKEINDKIQFVLPQEGSELFVDGFAISNSSANKDLAYRFIDYMIALDQQIASSLYLNFPTPNKRAVEMLTESHPDFVATAEIFPPDNVVKKLHTFGAGSPTIGSYWKRIFK